MTVEKQTIEVKGEAPREVELRFTRHGPVAEADGAGRRAFAMRSIWSEPGLAGYFGSSRLTHAKDWNDFKAASHAWGAPPLNLVYADTKGNIGWAASGRTPVRKNWDGLMPVPGDGRYEWNGFFAKDMLPSSYNPSEGFFATANEYNLPAGYPIEIARSRSNGPIPLAFSRIKEVLQAKPKFSLADAMDLQNDDTSMLGRRLVALLKPIRSEDPKQRAALELLQNWDARETADSGAAALFEIWTAKHLGRATVAATAPEAARGIVGNGSISAVVDYLEKPDQALGADINAARDRILLTSLNAAAEEAGKLMGDDMAQWRWGHLRSSRVYACPEAARRQGHAGADDRRPARDGRRQQRAACGRL